VPEIVIQDFLIEDVLPLRGIEGIDWITALRSGQIADLAAEGLIEPLLFGEKNLAEIQSPDFPDERLIATSLPVQKPLSSGPAGYPLHPSIRQGPICLLNCACIGTNGDVAKVSLGQILQPIASRAGVIVRPLVDQRIHRIAA